MAFVGQAQRLGWMFGQQGLPAALFVFDDALVFVKLRVGAALGLGLRAGKKEQEAVRVLAESPGLTPDGVMDRWPQALNLATADIVKARLGPSIQGFLAGAQRLEIDVLGGRTYAFAAASAAKASLIVMLSSVLGDRFDASAGQISQASLDALSESRKHDRP